MLRLEPLGHLSYIMIMTQKPSELRVIYRNYWVGPTLTRKSDQNRKFLIQVKERSFLRGSRDKEKIALLAKTVNSSCLPKQGSLLCPRIPLFPIQSRN